MKTPPDITDVGSSKACEGFIVGTLCYVGLLGRSRSLCVHLGLDRLANRMIYWLRRSSPTCLANRLAVPLGPRRGCFFGAGTSGGGLLPQTAASGNVSQPDPESLMNYPG
jgi:hypothetical protein